MEVDPDAKKTDNNQFSFSSPPVRSRISILTKIINHAGCQHVEVGRGKSDTA